MADTTSAPQCNSSTCPYTFVAGPKRGTQCGTFMRKRGQVACHKHIRYYQSPQAAAAAAKEAPADSSESPELVQSEPLPTPPKPPKLPRAPRAPRPKPIPSLQTSRGSKPSLSHREAQSRACRPIAVNTPPAPTAERAKAFTEPPARKKRRHREPEPPPPPPPPQEYSYESYSDDDAPAALGEQQQPQYQYQTEQNPRHAPRYSDRQGPPVGPAPTAEYTPAPAGPEHASRYYSGPSYQQPVYSAPARAPAVMGPPAPNNSAAARRSAVDTWNPRQAGRSLRR